MALISVLDASALIALARSESGADMVEDVLTEPGRICYAHAVNMCELFYYVLRASGTAEADKTVRGFRDAGVVVREDMDTAFWRQVGQNKVSFTLALGDCFCLALTQQLGGEVITSDHQFDPVDAQGVCPVRFIRLRQSAVQRCVSERHQGEFHDFILTYFRNPILLYFALLPTLLFIVVAGVTLVAVVQRRKDRVAFAIPLLLCLLFWAAYYVLASLSSTNTVTVKTASCCFWAGVITACWTTIAAGTSCEKNKVG